MCIVYIKRGDYCLNKYNMLDYFFRYCLRCPTYKYTYHFRLVFFVNRISFFPPAIKRGSVQNPSVLLLHFMSLHTHTHICT